MANDFKVGLLIFLLYLLYEYTSTFLKAMSIIFIIICFIAIYVAYKLHIMDYQNRELVIRKMIYFINLGVIGQITTPDIYELLGLFK